METPLKLIARVNNVDIFIIDNSKRLIPIKPICEALGVDHSSQLTKLKGDPFFSKILVRSKAVGADGKSHEMACIPAMYVLGWLFTINPKNVKPESKELVRKAKMECYEIVLKLIGNNFKLPMPTTKV